MRLRVKLVSNYNKISSGNVCVCLTTLTCIITTYSYIDSLYSKHDKFERTVIVSHPVSLLGRQGLAPSSDCGSHVFSRRDYWCCRGDCW